MFAGRKSVKPRMRFQKINLTWSYNNEIQREAPSPTMTVSQRLSQLARLELWRESSKIVKKGGI